MKQETKKLLLGCFYLIALFVFLGFVQYIFEYILAFIFLLYRNLYQSLLIFAGIGFAYCLYNAIRNYKQTIKSLKNHDWRGFIETAGGILSLIAFVLTLVFVAKGFMSYDYEGEDVAKIMAGLSYVVLFAIVVVSIYRKK